jgi:hypothetical protein
MTLLGDLGVTTGLRRRPGQQIGDVSDSWRSLLLGAPPTVV